MHDTYNDDSGACMLQCLLLLIFYSFSIHSRHDMGLKFFVLACHCKNVLSVKSNSVFSSSRQSYFTHSLGTRFKLYYVCNHDFV